MLSKLRTPFIKYLIDCDMYVFCLFRRLWYVCFLSLLGHNVIIADLGLYVLVLKDVVIELGVFMFSRESSLQNEFWVPNVVFKALRDSLYTKMWQHHLLGCRITRFLFISCNNKTLNLRSLKHLLYHSVAQEISTVFVLLFVSSLPRRLLDI